MKRTNMRPSKENILHQSIDSPFLNVLFETICLCAPSHWMIERKAFAFLIQCSISTFSPGFLDNTYILIIMVVYPHWLSQSYLDSTPFFSSFILWFKIPIFLSFFSRTHLVLGVLDGCHIGGIDRIVPATNSTKGSARVLEVGARPPSESFTTGISGIQKSTWKLGDEMIELSWKL